MQITNRLRRLRNNPSIRQMIRENDVKVEDFIYPIFVIEGENIKKEISSLPGQYHFSVDMLEKEMEEVKDLGIKSVLLFGIPDHKDEIGSQSYHEEGIIQKAIRKIKETFPDMYVITDVCMCEYTDHGHCGILNQDGSVDNDATLDYLAKIALSHAQAGADMIAPSDMMDGRIGYIRSALDKEGYRHIPLMAYSAKYCSNYYGPFREAAGSAPSFGDRKTYQMDFANSDEALREVECDIEEGADIVMVKPALSYLDIIRRVKDETNIPIAAYNVSGEYSMLKMAVAQGIFHEDVIYESILSIKRAGADIIITYFAKEFAKKMKEGKTWT